MATSLQKGALSNDLKGVVAKIFPGASPRTTIFARFARVWYKDAYLLALLVFGIRIPNIKLVRTGLTTGNFGVLAPPLIDRSNDAPRSKKFRVLQV